MIIATIKGDLADIYERGGSIAHGCNCHHTMGGLAGFLSRKFPEILEADEESQYGNPLKLGTWTKAYGKNGGECFNLYTQFHPGADLRYGALLDCFMNLNKLYAVRNPLENKAIYIPMIGAGLGGGDWDTIYRLIHGHTPQLDITLVTL
ncbi:macro domain protein [Serratia phage 4S]|nr:macro domain protein [Serratia phage 4S]